jgi:hypothetical protein
MVLFLGASRWPSVTALSVGPVMLPVLAPCRVRPLPWPCARG